MNGDGFRPDPGEGSNADLDPRSSERVTGVADPETFYPDPGFFCNPDPGKKNTFKSNNKIFEEIFISNQKNR